MPAIAHSVGTVSPFDIGGRLRSTDARFLEMLREMLRFFSSMVTYPAKALTSGTAIK
jgi:hypothetical protein